MALIKEKRTPYFEKQKELIKSQTKDSTAPQKHHFREYTFKNKLVILSFT